MKPAIRIAAAGAALLATAPRVLAQGCAMCYTEASAQNPTAQRHLNYAILTLLVPSVLMFGGVLFAAFRRREQDPAKDPTTIAGRAAPQISVPGRRPNMVSNASASSFEL